MEIRYKRLLPGAVEPRRMTPGSHGFDLFAAEDVAVWPQSIVTVRTGIALELCAGVEAQVRSRSGLAQKGIIVANAPGTIDLDYRDEVLVILLNLTDSRKWQVKIGDRIAQLVFSFVPVITLKAASELLPTGRGGFGSTGR